MCGIELKPNMIDITKYKPVKSRLKYYSSTVTDINKYREKKAGK